MRGDAHAGFGERPAETGWWRHRHRAAGRLNLFSRVTAVEDGVALHYAQLSINASSEHEAAMLFVSGSTEPFRVCDLPGLSAAQQTELARTLIVSGFLVRCPTTDVDDQLR